MADKKAQLKELMRKSREEKSQQKVVSPYAKYNNSGQLTCIICKEVIKSETLWTVHLASKKHKSTVESLLEKVEKPTQKPPTPKVTPSQPKSNTSQNSNSNSLVGDYDEDEKEEEQPKHQTIAAKKRTFDQIESEELKAPESSLPVDFFDNPEDAPKSTQPSTQSTPTTTSSSLPQGFFANREMDAKARKTDPIDINSEYQKFQDMISGDLEKVERDEEEQEEKAFKEEDKVLEEVMSDRKKRMEELLKKAQEVKQNQEKTMKTQSSNQKEQEDDSDDDLFNWRVKGRSKK